MAGIAGRFSWPTAVIRMLAVTRRCSPPFSRTVRCQSWASSSYSAPSTSLLKRMDGRTPYLSAQWFRYS